MCPANAKNSRGRRNICRYRGLDSGGLLLVALKLISDYLSGWAQLLGSGIWAHHPTGYRNKCTYAGDVRGTTRPWRQVAGFLLVSFLFLLFGGWTPLRFLASSLGYCYYFCVYLRQLMNDPLTPRLQTSPSPLAYAVFLPTNSLDECWITVWWAGEQDTRFNHF